MPLTAVQLKALREAPLTGGNRIACARRLLGLTQTEMGQQLGMQQPEVSNLEHQRYGGITVARASKIANYFGCHIEDLFPMAQRQREVA
jgi:DNA-binding XRE family transcriptional regulator